MPNPMVDGPLTTNLPREPVSRIVQCTKIVEHVNRRQRAARRQYYVRSKSRSALLSLLCSIFPLITRVGEWNYIGDPRNYVNNFSRSLNSHDKRPIAVSLPNFSHWCFRSDDTTSNMQPVRTRVWLLKSSPTWAFRVRLWDYFH